MKYGPYAGKEIKFAPTSRIEEIKKVADEFMFEIFEFEAGDYLISDESTLSDFTGFGISDTLPLWKQIKEQYGICPEDVASEKLIDIVLEIQNRRHPQ